jgi:hypothetical protein
MLEVLDIGDRVETGSYRLHSRFHGALAFLREGTGGLVCVVDETKGAGPVHIVVRGLDFASAERLEVGAEAVSLGAADARIERRSQSQLPRLTLDAARLQRNLGALREELLASAPARSIVFLLEGRAGIQPVRLFEAELAKRLRAGVARLTAGHTNAAASICGLGAGLTPSGDDFLAGYLLGLYALGVPEERRPAIRDAVVTGNPFSAALLDCAAEGRCIEPAGSLVRALFEGTEVDVVRETRRLAAVGASSGADLAVGLYFGLTGEQAW